MANLSDLKIGDRVRFDMYRDGKIIEGVVERTAPTSDGKDSTDPDHTPDAVLIRVAPGLSKWAWVKDLQLVEGDFNGKA